MANPNSDEFSKMIESMKGAAAEPENAVGEIKRVSAPRLLAIVIGGIVGLIARTFIAGVAIRLANQAVVDAGWLNIPVIGYLDAFYLAIGVAMAVFFIGRAIGVRFNS